MKLNQLEVIMYKGVPVLTTAQLAALYGATSKRISNNYNENKERYTSGKHHFELKGQELKDFLMQSRISGVDKKTSKLYLWTDKGALLHAKSLGTDEAWETYEELIDEYFDVQDQLDELTMIAKKNGFVTFAQFNSYRFSVGRTIKTFRDCSPRELIGIAEDFRDYVGQLDAETRINRCKSAIKGLEERYNKTGFAEANRIIVEVMHVQHVTEKRSQGQRNRREKEKLVRQFNLE
ncbi:ORF6N domain-containing protein [Paenibacillus thailandensis]|uniref:ORF6N domain-containing protein n=1 Tax=Paenibacillus thailandensis TaxID=393250 RepID=A0ABW5R2N5_9BACL